MISSIDCGSPKNANGAIRVPVLTPVTASNSGLASGFGAGTFSQPFRKPAPKAPQSPPPEMIRISITRRCFPSATDRSYSALVRSGNGGSALGAAAADSSSAVVRSFTSSSCETCGRVRAGPQPPRTSIPTSTDVAINEHFRLAVVELSEMVERTITGILLRMGYLRSKKSSLILEISTQERKNRVLFLIDCCGLFLGSQGGLHHNRPRCCSRLPTVRLAVGSVCIVR